MKGTVSDQSERPLPLDRLHFPAATESFEPFVASCRMPHDIRNPDQPGRYVEGVTVLAACDDGERVFVKFYRTGNTAWISTDRLADR